MLPGRKQKTTNIVCQTIPTMDNKIPSKPSYEEGRNHQHSGQ